MTHTTPIQGNLRRFAAAAYLLAVLLVLLPLFDTAANWGSVQPGSAAWRFGAVGSLSEVVLLPLVGAFLFFVVAHAQGSVLAQRVLEVVTLVVAVLLLATMAVFVLDAVQMRAAVAQGIQRFDLVVIRAIAGQAIAMVLLALLAISSIRARRRGAVSESRRAAESVERPGLNPFARRA